MTNFTMIQNEILNLELSGQAFKLYCILKSYCFNNKTTCFPSQKTLSEKLNKSVRTVQRALKELCDCGLITVKRRGSISNVYELSSPKSEADKDNNDNIDSSASANTNASIDSTNARKHDNVHSELSYIYKGLENKSNNNLSKYNFKPQNNWNKKEDSFNDFHQRNYDFDKLESLLLGQATLPNNLYEILNSVES